MEIILAPRQSVIVVANREDANLEGSIPEGKEKVHETTHVIGEGEFAEVRLPDSRFERQRTHKVVSFNKPARCAKNNCRLEASRRVLMHGLGEKNYCSQHWAKIAPNTDSYDPSTMMIIRPEDGEEIRGEDRVDRQLSRANAAITIHKYTGIHLPVRGPGNPRERIDPEAETQTETPAAIDHVTPVIKDAVERGGHNLPAITPVDAAALMHQHKVGGVPKSKEQELDEIFEELKRNPTTQAPNEYDEYRDLMK